MIKKRERTIFFTDRLKQFSEEYHARKAAEAKQFEAAATTASPRQLLRSNSIQEELLTTF
jgi:hypothetical protein